PPPAAAGEEQKEEAGVGGAVALVGQGQEAGSRSRRSSVEGPMGRSRRRSSSSRRSSLLLEPTSSSRRRSPSWTLHINGKALLPSYANLVRFMAPFALWNAAVVIIYAVSLAKLSDMQGPLASLNMASHVIYRYTRMRARAWGFVMQDDPGAKAAWREMFKSELRLFENEYNVMMYGGVALSQSNNSFHEEVPASTFQSAAFAQEFFKQKACFRWDPSLCFAQGHKYYAVTHNGLDVMVRRVIQEATLLSLDPDSDAVYNRSRYDFIHMVGGRDCYEGLQSAAQLFVDFSIGRYQQVTRLHMILLAVTCAGAVLYVVLLLWPHLRRTRRDALRQGALLSHVPAEVDVRGHVRAVFRRAALTAGGRSRRSSSGFGGEPPGSSA
ncbi:hypothetical protein Agub_g3050, partial [Astrephomene gubernaculifera]